MKNGKKFLRLVLILPVTWLALLLIGSVTYSGGVQIASAQETTTQTTESSELDQVTEAFFLMKYDLAVEKAAHRADAKTDSIMFFYMQQSYIERMEHDKHQRRREMLMVFGGVLAGGFLIWAGASVVGGD